MATLASLAIDLTANSAKMVKELKKANGHLNNFAKTAEIAGKVARTALVAATTGLFGQMIKESIDATDQMGKLHQRLGISTEALSELKHVAELSGVSFGTLTMGLQRMTRRLAEAGATGKGEALPALEELGISARKIAQLAPEDQFEVIADALKNLSSEGDRVRLAMKFFDSEGVALVQTMGEGAKGIRAMRNEARDLGLTLSKNDTQAAAEFNDQLTRMNARLTGITQKLGIAIVKPLNDLADAFLMVSNTRPANLSKELESFADAVKGIGFAALSASKAIAGLVTMMWNLNRARVEAYDGLISFDGSKLKSAADIAKGAFQGFKAELIEIGALYDNLYNVESPEEVAVNGNVNLQASNESPTGTVAPEGSLLNNVKLSDEEKQDAGIVDPLAALEESLLLQEEVMQDAYLRQREMLIENLLFEQDEKAKFRKLDAKLTQKYLDDVLKKTWFHNQKVLKWEKLTGKQKYQVAESTWRKLTAGVAAGNETISKINKAFAIKDAIVNTFRGVSQSLAAYPMPVAAGFAAMHLAAGLATVQGIRGGGSSGGGGSVSSASIPAISTPAANDPFIGEPETEEVTKTVIIAVEGIDDDALLNKKQLRQIFEVIEDEGEINARFVI